MDVFVYEVELFDDKVFKGLSYIGVGNENIAIYTPYDGRLCGRSNLLKDETYLFTGQF